MNDERFDDWIRGLARDQNAPPPTPREEIWAAIRAERHRERFSGARRYPVWLAAVAGIAAVLLVGVELGRLSVRPGASAPVAATAPSAPTVPVAGSGPTAYRVVATEHLGQAELLLTSFRTEARSGEIDATVGVWARDLLTTTRLLLDSPAGADPALRRLLEDLELVLAQLAQLPLAPSTDEARMELELASDAIEEAGVLPKIRTALQAGTPPPFNQEEL